MGLRLFPVVDTGIQVWNAVEVNKIAAEGGMKYPEPILDSYQKFERFLNREKAVQAVLYRTSLYTEFRDEQYSIRPESENYSLFDIIEEFFQKMNVNEDFCEVDCDAGYCWRSCVNTMIDEGKLDLRYYNVKLRKYKVVCIRYRV